MAQVREPAMMYGGVFDAAAAEACGGFESQLPGYGHDALLDVDAAALFGGYVVGAGAGALVAEADGAEGWWVGVSSSSSVLAFDRAARGANGAAQAVSEEGECDAWIEAMDQSYSAAEAPLTERGSGAGRQFGLLFQRTLGGACPDRARAAPSRASQKRPHAVAQGADSQAVRPTKKQCGASRKTTKPKSAPTTTPTNDPQSLAAKNRRERISQRLRTLQELVPNGTKVDLVTMLEKAISYVKFLQLQVKLIDDELQVLATDEFWPAQGGKAPEISQVKDALDAILSATTSSSSSSRRRGGQLN
ncbi:hypothetical protein GUJ93_ZPchr0002g26072 [Zizania palustris]|uniref:BHLH domain-containing protein n=1 Tax=Zizania palustris TaxID=103762 RepID=A0A8J5RS85_ZIZPA|nr:hypothetical protein GUJ93_ZPchr0002g26072 [Zizania palustris]